MAASQLSSSLTACRNIVIASIFFAVTRALQEHSKGQTFSSKCFARKAQVSLTHVKATQPKKSRSLPDEIRENIYAPLLEYYKGQIFSSKYVPEKAPKSLFRSLPVEIRERIYEHAMRQGGHFSHLTHVDGLKWDTSHITQRRSGCLPNVCFTSKVERLIATSVFIRNTTFHLSTWADATILALWLEKEQEHGHRFRSVRSMELSYIPSGWPIGFNEHFDLLQRCSGLRELIVRIPLNSSNFVVYNDAHVPISTRSLTYIELLAKFQVGGMLESAQLRCIKFKISSNYTSRDAASRLPLYELTKLARLIETAFFNRHRRALKCEYAFSSEQGTVLGDFRDL
jgi:hypothetical protein